MPRAKGCLLHLNKYIAMFIGLMLKLNTHMSFVVKYVMMCVCFVACPNNCEECFFNTSATRAECSKCEKGHGVTDEERKCEGKY